MSGGFKKGDDKMDKAEGDEVEGDVDEVDEVEGDEVGEEMGEEGDEVEGDVDEVMRVMMGCRVRWNGG